jgi:hypothetical protein
MDLPDIPLTPEASRFLERIRPKIAEGLQDVQRVPVAVLLWGPGITSSHPLAGLRSQLRAVLRANGHLALLSEELWDPASSVSLRVQQLVQAESFDLVVSIPATAGAIGEVHDFAAHPRVNSKLLVFLNQECIDGYSEQSLRALSTVLSCQVEYYASEDDASQVERVIMEQAQRLREIKFMYGWKVSI